MKKSLLIGLYVVFILACKHSPVQTTVNPVIVNPPDTTNSGQMPCSPDTVYFQNEILPILISNCSMSGCHDELSHKDGVVLTSYNTIMQTGEVEPGDPGDSEIYEKITENKLDKRMPPPPYDALAANQVDKIKKWIEQGAKNNFCDACDTVSEVRYSAFISPLLQTNCVGCHNQGNPGGGYVLNNFATVKSLALNGKLYGVVSHSQGFSAMPKNGLKLSDCNILKIKKWIDNGAPEN